MADSTVLLYCAECLSVSPMGPIHVFLVRLTSKKELNDVICSRLCCRLLLVLLVHKDDASATVAVSNALVGTTPDEAREQQPQQQQQPQRPQQRQPQQPQNVFLGAEDVAERLAGGEGLNCDDGVVHSSGKAGVFYNRVGAINRDLSVLMANVLAEERIAGRYGKKKKRRRMRSTPATSATADNGAAKSSGVTSAGDVEEEGLVVLDAFAASGVRALRYDVLPCI